MDPIVLTTIAAGRVALGAAINGPNMARLPPRTKHETTSAGDTSEATLAFTDRTTVAMYATILGGWLTERRALLSRGLERDARATVALKDAFVAGAVLTGAAAIVAEGVMRRSYPHGVPVTAKGALATSAPASVDTYRGYFKLIGALNRIFVVGAIGATPFINFALFNDYRPKPLSKFFSF